MTASQKMPNATDVLIEHQKITRYLLNLEHKDDGPKTDSTWRTASPGAAGGGWRTLCGGQIVAVAILARVCDTKCVDMAIPPIVAGQSPHLTGHIPTTIE